MTALRSGHRTSTHSGLPHCLHAEWTKIRTLPGTLWLLAAAAVLTIAGGLAADTAARCATASCGLDPARTALTGVYVGQALIVIAGVWAVSSEYGTGMIQVSLAATPRRTKVLAAKVAVTAGLVLAAGTAAAAGSLMAGLMILPDRGFTAAHGYGWLVPGDGTLLRAAGGTVLYFALIGLLSLGIATVARDAALATATVLGLLYVVPIIATVVTAPGWHRHLQQLAPMTAGLAIQDTSSAASAPIHPWAGLAVLTGWAVAALVAGSLVMRFRDA